MRKVPVVLQSEATDCGLAALLMVARYFGHDMTLDDLRRRSAAGNAGPTLQSILSLADELALDARPVRATMDEIGRLRLPAILHWQMQHFVVLCKVGPRQVEICDPARGRLRCTRSAMSREFSGVAVEFSRLSGFTPVASQKPVTPAGLLRSFRGLGRYLLMMLVLLFATQFLGLLVPVATQLLVDEVVRGQDLGWLRSVLAGIGCVMLAVIVLDVLQQRLALYTGIQLSIDVAAATIRRLLALPVGVLERRTAADTLSRIDSLQPVLRFLTESGLNALVQAVTLAMTLALMFFYSPLLSLLSVVTLIAAVILQLAVLPRSRERNLDGLVAQAAAKQSLIESLRGYSSVVAFNLGNRRLSHWRHAFTRASNARADQGKLSIVATCGQNLIGSLDQLAFLLLGISAVANKSITLGALFAFVGLRGRLGVAAGSLIGTGRELYLLRNHVVRVSELLAEEIEAPPAESALRATLSGQIECVRVSYHYPAGAPVLVDFSCRIDAGERVAICGPSGIGKTTLLRLLATERQPDSGVVAFDGADAGFWDYRRLREQFAVVRQHDTLFTGSVADNISCFSETPDFVRLREAARLACIWGDIAALPMKLDTPLLDGGASLSGGQVQRLLLARALYRQPSVLFLDEATNQLDDATETRVLANLAGLRITIVSVAHGEKTLRQSGRPLALGLPQHGNCRATIP